MFDNHPVESTGWWRRHRRRRQRGGFRRPHPSAIAGPSACRVNPNADCNAAPYFVSPTCGLRPACAPGGPGRASLVSKDAAGALQTGA